MAENTAQELKNFFSTPEKPCTTQEYMEFWKSLDEEEKAYYKNAELV